MLLTKLHIPAPAKNMVHRSVLFPLLNEGFRRKLILISAPAGYGKTMLLSDWIHQHKIKTAWFSIDTRDNNPYEFLGLVLAGIQAACPAVGDEALALIHSAEPVHFDYILEALMNDFLMVEDDLLLVLDDFHLIDESQILEQISYLLEHLPPQLHLAISTRSDPPLSLGRMRSRDELVEIRSGDLNFSEAEIFNFFNKKLRIKLSAKDLQNLAIKTEGWVAGLQLTTIAIEGRDDFSAYIEKLAGDNRYIMDYLIEEVLHRQTKEIQDFLLQTSALEQFNAELCNAVCEINNSWQILDLLDRGNMFLVPLDDERKWYRYHHLFGDLLKLRLGNYFPKKIQRIHEQASDWFCDNDMIVPAIEHSFEAGDQTKAMHLLNQIADEIWKNGQVGISIRFGRQFDEDVLLANYHFCLVYCWGLTIVGQLSLAENILSRLLAKLEAEEPTPEIKGLICRVFVTLNLLYSFVGDTKKAVKFSTMAMKSLSYLDPVWSIWAHICYGEVCVSLLDVKNSHQSFALALDSSYKQNIPFLTIISAIEVGYTLILKGRYKEAFQLCSSNLDEIGKQTPSAQKRVEIYTSMFHAMMGLVLAEWNQMAESLQHATLGYELSRNTDNTSFVGYCGWLYANTLVKHNNLNLALEITETLESDKRLNQLLYAMFFSLHVKILVLQSKFREAENYRALANQRIEIINEYETYLMAIADARHKLETYQLKEALELLNNYADKTKQKGVTEMYLETELLRAKGFVRLKQHDEANKIISEVLQLATNEEMVRCFVCEGSEIADLIRHKQTTNSPSPDINTHLEAILAAFNETKSRAQILEEEILSKRELDTLKLMAENLSNREIAEKLFISLNTVKTHLKNINLKLEVDNRNKAVAKAREMGLL